MSKDLKPKQRLGQTPGAKRKRIIIWTVILLACAGGGYAAYRYTNVASGFTALVAVDALALPVSYERIWTRIADWQGDGS